MIKNLAITTPVLGSIRMGGIIEQGGKRLPVRHSHFSITAQYKDRDGNWAPHPMQKAVAERMGVDDDKITEIPIRLMYNNPELNMRARYEAFDRNGRIVCAGNGETAMRADGSKVAKVDCPGADHCAFGDKARCDLFARLNVQIEGQDDPFSSFILRTESVNSVRTLWAKMTNMHAAFGNRLTGIPFVLKMRQKASSGSHWSRFFFADLILNKISIQEAMMMAIDNEETMQKLGINVANLEQQAMMNLQNGAFEEDSSDFGELEPFLLARQADDADEVPLPGAATDVGNKAISEKESIDEAGDATYVGEEPAPILPSSLADLRALVEATQPTAQSN